MLLLLVLGMLEVLVVLIELVVFVGEIFERVNAQTYLRGNYRIRRRRKKREKNGAKKIQKSLSQSKKTTFTLESYKALFPFEFFKFVTI